MTDYAPSANIQEEVLTFLLSSPTPERIIGFHVSDAAQARLRYLLDANRALMRRLTPTPNPSPIKREGLGAPLPSLWGRGALPALEAQLNALVYQAYGLTEDEIALVEGRA